MTRRLVPALVAVLLGAATAVATLLPVTVAAADPVSQCTTRAGVLVAVDFRSFGGSITRGCDATPTTGLDALHEAGYSTEGTKHDGPAFVCRIDGKPSAAQEACYNTPPASAYWSYWHADSGQNRWTYAKTGAQDTHPGPGSVDAWVFGSTGSGGSGGGPTFTPEQVRNPSGRTTSAPRSSPPPPPATTRVPAPRRASARHLRVPVATRASAPATRASSAGRVTPARTTAAARRATSAVPASTSVATSAPTSSAASGTSGAPTVVDATPLAARPGSGSPLPLIVGLLIVLALAAGGGWTVYRRRQLDAAP